MYSIKDLLHNVGLTKREQVLSSRAVESLRTTFQTRYHEFKLLLNANNKALEIMAELEEARSGEKPFGIFFVNSRCTAVCVNVFRAIEILNELAPGRYSNLYEPFRSIESKIGEIIQSARRSTGAEPRIIPLRNLDITRSNLAGNKLANLGEIHNRLGITVPNGFVISSRAFREVMGSDLQAEIDRLMQSFSTEEMDQVFLLSTQVQQQILQAEVPAELEKEIFDAYCELKKEEGQDLTVALRSSAVGEDSSRTSYAGLYHSELNVSGDSLIQAYKKVVASKYNPEAIVYRMNRGIRDEDVDMCVGCVSMVNAIAGGVVYSKNPLDGGDERIFIHSTYGLPKGVVDGSVGDDLLVLARNPLRIDELRPGQKREKIVCDSEGGVRQIEVPAHEHSLLSIAESTALKLAAIALRIEEHYGCAQDIEWALDEKAEIVILQSRPLRYLDVVAEEKRNLVEVPPSMVIASGGLIASPGAASGPVFVLRKESEILSFPEGAVLVVKQALPRWATVLARASALIAEQGSAAGHLANVAREFGVPAIVGLEGATDLLENGRPVTVDADGLRVCAGRIELLLANRRKSRGLMDGSPVLAVLNRVMECINPLNLLDPQALDFKPSSCQTLHDITRFCHEMAVLEMFSFGKDHQFSEKSSKRLMCDGVPMQWWVLNLDDGFKADVAGKFVSMDNIASIPMLALWEGIIAVPWAGPPALEPGSLLSLMLESARNPETEPSLPSPYKNRNYFMISKNFCSLASRFGYHLSGIEALVSERANENYVSFSFEGGAANYDARVRRVRLVVSILDEFGFHSEVRGDCVTARAEGDVAEEMIQKLTVLGYLLIHTRQVDIAMTHDATCAQWKQKLLADISNFILPKFQDRAAHS